MKQNIGIYICTLLIWLNPIALQANCDPNHCDFSSDILNVLEDTQFLEFMTYRQVEDFKEALDKAIQAWEDDVEIINEDSIRIASSAGFFGFYSMLVSFQLASYIDGPTVGVSTTAVTAERLFAEGKMDRFEYISKATDPDVLEKRLLDIGLEKEGRNHLKLMDKFDDTSLYVDVDIRNPNKYSLYYCKGNISRAILQNDVNCYPIERAQSLDIRNLEARQRLALEIEKRKSPHFKFTYNPSYHILSANRDNIRNRLIGIGFQPDGLGGGGLSLMDNYNKHSLHVAFQRSKRSTDFGYKYISLYYCIGKLGTQYIKNATNCYPTSYQSISARSLANRQILVAEMGRFLSPQWRPPFNASSLTMSQITQSTIPLKTRIARRFFKSISWGTVGIGLATLLSGYAYVYGTEHYPEYTDIIIEMTLDVYEAIRDQLLSLRRFISNKSVFEDFNISPE